MEVGGLFDWAQNEAQIHKGARPITADSQCGKLAQALLNGETFTTLEAQRITGGTEAARRIRELRATLKLYDITLWDRWEKSKTAKFKRYGLSAADRDKLGSILR